MSASAVIGEALHRTFLNNWYQLPGWLSFAAALLAALRWGGRAERWIGLWLLGDYVLHALVSHVGRELQAGQAAPIGWVVAADLVFLPAYLWPVARSKKVWPLFFAACYLLMVLCRVLRLLLPEVGEWAGATAVVIWTVMAQAAFTVGVVRCLMLRRSAGVGTSSR